MAGSYSGVDTSLFADSGRAGKKLETTLHDMDGRAIEIIKRADGPKGFVFIARRWGFERTVAWLGDCRRLVKNVGAWLMIAFIRRTTRLITRA